MNVEIGVEADFGFECDGNGDHVRGLVDRLMEELVKLAETDCGITDPAISLDLGARRITAEMSVSAIDFDTATTVADSSFRAAAHAAGWMTPDWSLSKRSQRTELLDA